MYWRDEWRVVLICGTSIRIRHEGVLLLEKE